jgi:uncharacterized protein YjeT (DUF2065 family)
MVRVAPHARPRSNRQRNHAPGQHVVDSLWPAFALLLIVEGVLPFAAPRAWRETFRKLIELSDGQLRFIGLLSMALGVVSLVVIHYA